MRMYAKIKLDREISKGHYISPGGYEMCFENGKTTQFDFLTYEGKISGDRMELEFWHYDLDDESFPESNWLRASVSPIVAIPEFFIYTGEFDEPEIYPTELLELRLYNDNNEEIPIKMSLKDCVFGT